MDACLAVCVFGAGVAVAVGVVWDHCLSLLLLTHLCEGAVCQVPAVLHVQLLEVPQPGQPGGTSITHLHQSKSSHTYHTHVSFVTGSVVLCEFFLLQCVRGRTAEPMRCGQHKGQESTPYASGVCVCLTLLVRSMGRVCARVITRARVDRHKAMEAAGFTGTSGVRQTV